MELTSYRARTAFTVAGTPSAVVSQINERAMDVATGAVAFLPAHAKSVGVPTEIGYLKARFTPVLVVTDPSMELASWVVAGFANDEIVKVVEMTEEGIEIGLEWLKDEMALVASLRNATANPVIFGRESPDAQLPTRGYPTDAGYDLYTSASTYIPAGKVVMVPTGVSVDLPEGTWGQVTGRSSNTRRGLITAAGTGVIDETYTGPLFAPVWNINDHAVTIAAGERVAQLILHEATGQRFRPAWGVVRAKDRGTAGFGSTGV